MEKIEHFILPENTNRLYQSEAASSISLTIEVAEKINEIIDTLNSFQNDDLAWKQEQNGRVNKAVVYMRDHLANSIQDLFNMLDKQGVIDSRIAAYAKDITARLDNLLSKVTPGSTTMDAEIIDSRLGDDGIKYATLGEAIRAQLHAIVRDIILYYNVYFDTTSGEIRVNHNANTVLYTIPTRELSRVHSATIADADSVATYDRTAGRPFRVVLNITDGVAKVKAAPMNDYVSDRNDIMLFVIYNNVVIPAGLAHECIIVDGKRLSENPHAFRKYAGNVISLDSDIKMDEKNMTFTLPGGFYIFPLYKTGASQLTEKTISYTITTLPQYVVYNFLTDTLSLQDRFYSFADDEFCLGVIYKGDYIPVELITPYRTESATAGVYTSIDDVFQGLSDNSKTTKIVLAGDSITHGVGGTGFAQDGEAINASFSRNPSGYCWAKLFKEYIESNYNATVTNNGCTGTWSWYWDSNKATLIPADTDIVILTIGTNDRNNRQDGDTHDIVLNRYYTYVSSVVDYCIRNGIKIVLCSPIPATAANEAEENKLAHCYELNAVIQRIAAEHNMEYANLYNEIFYHVMDNELDLAELMPDGLHPGDAMYKLMFYKYMKLFRLAPHYQIVE